MLFFRKKSEELDDIVFEKRNKEYGAYFLRQIYKKHVTRSLIITLIVFFIVVAVPLIASIVNKSRLIKEENSVTAELANLNKPPEEAPPPPPPPPPPEAVEKLVRFTAPKVVNDTVDQGPVFVQDDLNKNATNVAPNEGDIQVDEGSNKDNQVIEEAPPAEIFTIVEEQPTYPGGEQSRIKFLSENIKYPDLARENGIQGTVYVTFVVEGDGSITDIKVLKSIGAGCDEEAVRVVKIMPKWTPGKQRGKSVRVRINMPIKFKIEG